MSISAQRTKSETCGSILFSGVKTVTGPFDGYKNGYTDEALAKLTQLKLK
jgi:hypothetical protein